MKTKIAALTVLLLAGSATAALAQDHDRDRGESRGEARADHGASPVARAAPEFRAPEARAPEFRQERPNVQPRAEQPQPQAQAERRAEGGGRGEGGRRFGGEGQPQTSRWTGGERPSPTAGQPERQQRPDGARHWDSRAADNQDRQARNGDSQSRDGRDRGGQGRDSWNRGGQDHGENRDGRNRDGQNRGGWDGQRRDGDRNADNGRWDRQRQGGDRNNGRWDHNDVRHGGDRQAWNRDDHGRPHWDRNHYPPVYQSHQRYHRAWRAPVGFYAFEWGFGDILPAGWYGPEYQILDWWSFDLPAPPPGYDWVRVGYDAVLIDDYDGRVVQVVRMLFY